MSTTGELGRIGYETRNRRDPDAVPWELLCPDDRRREQKSACAVVAAAEPTFELMQARVAELSQENERLSREVLSAGNRAANAESMRRHEAADAKALMCEVLSSFDGAVLIPGGSIHSAAVDTDTFERWVKLAGIEAL